MITGDSLFLIDTLFPLNAFIIGHPKTDLDGCVFDGKVFLSIDLQCMPGMENRKLYVVTVFSRNPLAIDKRQIILTFCIVHWKRVCRKNVQSMPITSNSFL